jgi:hypothetical protein
MFDVFFEKTEFYYLAKLDTYRMKITNALTTEGSLCSEKKLFPVQ